MAKLAFLSKEWIAAARVLRDEYAGKAGEPAVGIRMNLVITEVPFGDETRHAHFDTTSGELTVELEHLPEPDLTVTLDYETAKALLIFQDSQAGINAFMAGRVRIEGDMSKLLAFQNSPQDPVHAEAAGRVREITK